MERREIIIVVLAVVVLFALGIVFLNSIHTPYYPPEDAFMLQKTIAITEFGKVSTSTFITVRNTGSVPINGTELSIYMSTSLTDLTNAKKNCSWRPDIVQPGSLSTCQLDEYCASGMIIKVTAPGNYDYADC